MKSIVFNFTGSRLSQKTEALALKAGYLLSDVMYTAGTAARDMFAKRYLSDLHPHREIELLINTYENQPEMLETMLKLQKTMKQSSKVKYKDRELLAIQKKTEKMVHENWLAIMDYHEKMIDSFGFKELKELIGEGVFGCYGMYEDPEAVTGKSMTASNLLQRLLLLEDEEDDEDLEDAEGAEIFFLGNEFLSSDYQKPTIYSAGDEQATDMGQIYLHHCFTLPDVNELTANELRVIHKQLQPAGELFRKSGNEWIDMCYFNDEIAQRIAFFTGQVLPAAETLQQAIISNETLQLCSRQQNDLKKIEVWMGEIPVWQLWDYYRHYNAIRDETWNILQQVKDDAAYKDQRWPVMMLNMPEEQHIVNEDQEELKSVKKYLSID